VTVKTQPVGKRSSGGLLPLDYDAVYARLEPIFFQEFLPKVRGKVVLYLAAAEAPLLPTLLKKEPAYTVCTGPVLPAKYLDKPDDKAAFVLSHFADSCFQKDRFEILVVPEASAKGVQFIPRIHYWASLLKKDGEMLVALPHPQARFLMGTRELQHRSSRTATFERVFERCRELHLSVLAVRELLVSHVPEPVMTATPKWQALKQEQGEWPLLLGLHVKKA